MSYQTKEWMLYSRAFGAQNLRLDISNGLRLSKVYSTRPLVPMVRLEPMKYHSIYWYAPNYGT